MKKKLYTVAFHYVAGKYGEFGLGRYTTKNNAIKEMEKFYRLKPTCGRIFDLFYNKKLIGIHDTIVELYYLHDAESKIPDGAKRLLFLKYKLQPVFLGKYKTVKIEDILERKILDYN